MQKTPLQLFRFAYIYLYTQSAIFLLPGLMESSGYQGWIAILGGFLLSLGVLWCTYCVGKLGKNKPWHEYGRQIVGKWPHKLFLTLMLCWFIYFAALEVENFTKFFGSIFMRETPSWAIIVIVSAAVFYTCHLGFTTLVYMAEGIFLLTIPVIGILVYLFFPNADFRMLPAMLHYHNPGLAFRDSIVVMGWLAEWMTFLFIVPEFTFDRKVLKNLVLAEAMMIVALLLGWFFNILNLRPYLGGQLEYPYLELIRGTSQGGMAGNSDAFFIAIWTTSMFIHNTFLIYAASKCMQQLFRIKNKNVNFLIGIAVAASIAYLYSRNPAVFQAHYSSMWLGYIWIAFESIPVVYYLISLLRWKKFWRSGTGKQKEEQKDKHEQQAS